jgi:hypothetical protein
MFHHLDVSRSLCTSRSRPNPKITNKQVEHKTKQEHKSDKVFIPWFISPLRLAYVHVVEEATKDLVSFNLILVLKSREQVS